MTEKFLKAKHWQLFLLFFGIPMIIELVITGNIFARFSVSPFPDPSVMVAYTKYFPILMLLSMGILFGWFWSVVTGLRDKIPADVKMNLTRFKFFFFIPLVYILFFTTYISSLMRGMMNGIDETDALFLGSFMAVILPLHLFSMFCIFHTMYFVAKTFKTAELQRRVTFSDFAGEFFMVCFFPIGVFIIQPKINTMMEKETSSAGGV